MATIRNRATLDNTEFQAGLKKMQTGVSSLSASLKSMTGLGGALTTAAIFQGFKGALAAADEVDNLSKQADIGVEAVQALKVVTEEAGLSFEALIPSISRLRSSMAEAENGSSLYAKAFESLGISMRDVRNMSTEQMLGRVAKAMSDHSGEAEASSAATDLLGEKSTKLNQIFKDLGSEGLDELIARLKEMNLINDTQTIKSLDRTEEHFNRLMRQVGTTGMEMTVAVLSGLNGVGAFTGALASGATVAEAYAITIADFRGELDGVAKSAIDATAAVEGLTAEQQKQVKAQVELSKLMFNDRFAELPVDQQISDLGLMKKEQQRIATESFAAGDGEGQLAAYKRVLEIEKQIGQLQDQQDKERQQSYEDREESLKRIIAGNQAELDAQIQRKEFEAAQNEEMKSSEAFLKRINAQPNQDQSAGARAIADIQSRSGKGESRAEKLQRETNEQLKRSNTLLGTIADNGQGVF